MGDSPAGPGEQEGAAGAAAGRAEGLADTEHAGEPAAEPAQQRDGPSAHRSTGLKTPVPGTDARMDGWMNL